MDLDVSHIKSTPTYSSAHASLTGRLQKKHNKKIMHEAITHGSLKPAYPMCPRGFVPETCVTFWSGHVYLRTCFENFFAYLFFSFVIHVTQVCAFPRRNVTTAQPWRWGESHAVLPTGDSASWPGDGSFFLFWFVSDDAQPSLVAFAWRCDGVLGLERRPPPPHGCHHGEPL